MSQGAFLQISAENTVKIIKFFMIQSIHCNCVCFSSILLLLRWIMTDKTHDNKFNSLSRNQDAALFVFCSVLTQESHFAFLPQRLVVAALVLLILCNCEVEVE